MLAILGVFCLTSPPHLYADDPPVAESTIDIEYERVTMCVTPDGEVIMESGGLSQGGECSGWELAGILATCIASAFATAACPILLWIGWTNPVVLLAAIVDCLGAAALCWQCFDLAAECDDPIEDVVRDAEERYEEIMDTLTELTEAMSAVCQALADDEDEELPAACEGYVEPNF